ncbi:methyltransferase domain-containing protein [Halalkalicoccus salilacus]|uniref:methyltransferase domain-containing protein n=1 Tax=Halalkalicoccus salilacus TaxID=3117459 RepID=UPI00300E8E00
MTDFEYDETAVAREEANYQTVSMRARRAFVREQVALKPGDSVLSVGCGPGFEPAELASAGRAEQITGLDSNPIMLARARERCPNDISLLRGDTPALPVADSTFDAAVSVQVYEYIENLSTALTELHRVLRADGRAVVYATDWDSLIWYVDDQERADRVLTAWNDHCAHPRLGSKLRTVLESSEFAIADITPYTILLTELGRDSYAHYLLESIREFVTPRVGEEPAQNWEEDLRTRDQCGESFFSLTQFSYLIEPA